MVMSNGSVATLITHPGFVARFLDLRVPGPDVK
jgi:hypothetical protein